MIDPLKSLSARSVEPPLVDGFMSQVHSFLHPAFKASLKPDVPFIFLARVYLLAFFYVALYLVSLAVVQAARLATRVATVLLSAAWAWRNFM